MPKVTLDMAAFKALASDTRLDILKSLDGKKMSLKDISSATRLNKATLHEHLSKLHEAGLVEKNEREGHKWVYYKLSWKGECLLHPENTKIVILFSATFIALFLGIVQLVNYVRGTVVGYARTFVDSGTTDLHIAEESDHLFRAASFSDTPITLTGANQTSDMLSQTLINEGNVKGTLGNTLSNTDIDWENAADGVKEVASSYSDGFTKDMALSGANGESSVTVSQIGVLHDPALQWIAIACLVIFAILLTIGIWRLRKNKTPKI